VPSFVPKITTPYAGSLTGNLSFASATINATSNTAFENNLMPDVMFQQCGIQVWKRGFCLKNAVDRSNQRQGAACRESMPVAGKACF